MGVCFSEKSCPKSAKFNLLAPNMDPLPPDSTADTEAYLRLLTQHDRWLATYFFSLVASTPDAQGILQEMKGTMWKQFGKLETGPNFRAGGRKIAMKQILNYRRAVQKLPN